MAWSVTSYAVKSAALGGLNGDNLLVLSFALEPHDSIGKGEQRIVFSNSHIGAGINPRSSLTHDDRPRMHRGPASGLDAEAATRRVTSVTT